ncbi:hypothetical protein C0995_011567 [Termitomyces sp. Mi166|nr:hypothetical protein C0995_011567 [Termitomyces sp. Mi166\
MPSVRLRGSAYSSLRDSPTSPRAKLSTSALNQNVESESTGDSTPSVSRSSPRMLRRSMPSLRPKVPQPDSDSEETSRPIRTRSGTTISRISTYIAGASRRHSRNPTSHGDSEPGFQTSSPLLSPRDARITHESPQAEVAVYSNRAPGTVGAISLVDSGDDTDDDSSLNLHHDEIVNHLDVIGEFCLILLSLKSQVIVRPTDRNVVKINDPSHPTSEGTVESGEGGRPDKQLQDSLDRHVDDVLRNPSTVRRTMLGFINFHNDNTQGFWIEVSSQVVNGLFTITGVGLIPYRTLDTYRIFWIWHYKRKTRRLRLKAGIPLLFDEDDLPDPEYDQNYVRVLTEKEEKFLYRRSYRVPFKANCADFSQNSASSDVPKHGIYLMEQRRTGFERPAWSTGILIPCGFLSGIAAAFLIWRGGHKTKRVAEVEERLRAALTANDDIPQHQTGYPPPRRRPTRKMTNLSEGLEEPEIRIDEHMTIPTTVVTGPST